MPDVQGGDMSEKRLDCWTCEYRGSVAGSAHICCEHPSTKEAHDNPMLKMASIFARVGRMPKELNIEADPLGIRNGWFIFPFKFDPTWLKNCDGYEKKEE
jgi:hypothetical protein